MVPRMSKPVKIRWSSGKKDSPDYDLCGRYQGQWVDVMNGVDGWTVSFSTSDHRWAHNGTTWVSGPKNAPPRGVPGAVTREEARVFAESLAIEI